MFWRRKEKSPVCKHHWILNDVYGYPINCGASVEIEDRYVLLCLNCHGTKEVDRFDYNRMKQHNLIKG